MAEFAIGHRMVGDGHPPLVIAEIGVNHNGSLPVALQMIAAAASAGAECVKLQTHIVEAEMVAESMPAHVAETIRRCALSEAQERQLQAFAHELGLLYISTPFSIEAADRLQSMDVPAFKIGSGELTNLPLLEHVASFGKPVILSTGMGSLDEVWDAVGVFEERCPFVIMHCTSMYPTPPECMRLGRMLDMRLHGLVGISDHSVGIACSLAAATLGACIIEKHFTLGGPCPDAEVSLYPTALRALVLGAPHAWLAGRGVQFSPGPETHHEPLPDELRVARWARHSVTLRVSVRADQVLTRWHLTTKRPARGIPASRLHECIGRTVTRDLPPDHQLQEGDLA